MAAVVAVAGPPDTDLDRLYEGISAAAERWACPVVGGDLVSSPTLVVTVTVIGDGDADGADGGGDSDRPPVPRSGARPADVLFVTGPLGASAAGLRLLRAGNSGGDAAAERLVAAHRRPQARVEEGQVARRAGATAMIDISDGLAADLVHVLDASAVGARLSEIPVVDGATLDEALGGGEDYELVFSAADPVKVERLFAAAGLRPPLRLGVCTADAGERTLAGQPLVAVGWEHPWR
jgi:thiamine-monophosphate kinase